MLTITGRTVLQKFVQQYGHQEIKIVLTTIRIKWPYFKAYNPDSCSNMYIVHYSEKTTVMSKYNMTGKN